MTASRRGGWRGSTRRATLPPGWARIRKQVLARDNYRCVHIRYDTGQRCNAYANQCDHIGDRDNHALDNLQSLCEYHHRIKSSEQGGAAYAAKYRKQKPKHPGIY